MQTQFPTKKLVDIKTGNVAAICLHNVCICLKAAAGHVIRRRLDLSCLTWLCFFKSKQQAVQVLFAPWPLFPLNFIHSCEVVYWNLPATPKQTRNLVSLYWCNVCFIDFSSHFLKAVEISALFAHSHVIQMPPLHRFINAPASFPPPTGCCRNSVKHLFAIQIMVAQEERQGCFVSCTQYSPCKAGLASVSKWQRQNIRLPGYWKTSEGKKAASPRTPLYFLSKCSFHWYKQLADFQLPFEPHCLEKPEKNERK